MIETSPHGWGGPLRSGDRSGPRSLASSPRARRGASWARLERVAWNDRPEADRAIFPLFSTSGRLEKGLRGRALRPSETAPAALAPIGGGRAVSSSPTGSDADFSRATATPLRESWAARRKPGLVIAEGEADFRGRQTGATQPTAITRSGPSSPAAGAHLLPRAFPMGRSASRPSTTTRAIATPPRSSRRLADVV